MRSHARLGLSLLVAVCASATLTMAVTAAYADGDPASDYLLTYQVFYPYYAKTHKASLAQLKSTVADANKRHFTIRVAVITSPYDLGSLSALWRKPYAYSRFLALELSYAYKGRLLVVTPNGYGYVRKTVLVKNTPTVKTAPTQLKLVRSIPIAKGTDGLLQTADKAVRLLAKNAGYSLTPL